MRVVGKITLRAADPMRVVTSIARRVLAPDMFVVLTETLVAQNAVPAVAPVAERIIECTFRSIVQRCVVS